MRFRDLGKLAALVALTLTWTVLSQAQPGLEAYQRHDLEAVRAYLAKGHGSTAETDFLRAALTTNADSALVLYRRIVQKYPDTKIGRLAQDHIRQYYYAQGLYAKAEETGQGSVDKTEPAKSLDSPDSSAPELPPLAQPPGNTGEVISTPPGKSTPPEVLPKTQPKPERDSTGTGIRHSSAAAPPVKSVPKAVKVAPPTPANESVKSSGFSLQLGAFGDAGNVQSLKDKLEKAGYQVTVTTLPTGKHLQVVRIVGIESQAKAEAISAEMKSKFGLNPVIQPHRD